MSESEKKNEKKTPLFHFQVLIRVFHVFSWLEEGGGGEEEDSAPQQFRQAAIISSIKWLDWGRSRVRAVVGLGCYE